MCIALSRRMTPRGTFVGVAQDIEARTMLRSTHSVLEALDIEAAMYGTGISLESYGAGR